MEDSSEGESSDCEESKECVEMTKSEEQKFGRIVDSIMSSCREECSVRMMREIEKGKEEVIQTISNALEEKLFDFKVNIRRDTVNFVVEKIDETAYQLESEMRNWRIDFAKEQIETKENRRSENESEKRRLR